MNLSSVMHESTKMRAAAGKHSFRRKQTIRERLAKA